MPITSRVARLVPNKLLLLAADFLFWLPMIGLILLSLLLLAAVFRSWLLMIGLIPFVQLRLGIDENTVGIVSSDKKAE